MLFLYPTGTYFGPHLLSAKRPGGNAGAYQTKKGQWGGANRRGSKESLKRREVSRWSWSKEKSQVNRETLTQSSPSFSLSLLSPPHTHSISPLQCSLPTPFPAAPETINAPNQGFVCTMKSNFVEM